MSIPAYPTPWKIWRLSYSDLEKGSFIEMLGFRKMSFLMSVQWNSGMMEKWNIGYKSVPKGESLDFVKEDYL